jgi:cytochrome c-type biogenesis protein CcmH
MADPSPSKRGVSAATIALGAAAILAAAAVGIAVFRSNEAAEAPAANVAAAAQAGSMDAAIASLEQEVRRDPDNHEKWFLLGMAYRDLERFPDAARAFRRAKDLNPRDANYYTYLGEALLLQGGRAPPPEAEALFRRAIELQPDNAAGRFYLATLRDSRGEHQGAIDDLLRLLRSAPPDAPWEAQVRQAVIAIAAERRIDISGRLPPPRQAQASTATAAIPGPTREQLDAARGLPPSEQNAMVRSMVDRLANRLRQNPRDAEGWIRLMRSRMVLNDPNAARDALRSGLAAFQGDGAAQQRLRTAASELGVPAA